jgi:hypothetical protein
LSGFVEFSSSLLDQSRPLGSLHLRLFSHESLPKSLDLSLTVFQTKREMKNKKERSDRRENEEKKRINIYIYIYIYIYNKKNGKLYLNISIELNSKSVGENIGKTVVKVEIGTF